MLHPTMTRRTVVKGAVAAGGLTLAKAGQAQDPAVLRVRANRDIQVLDPGYLVGGMEHSVLYAIMGQLAAYKLGETWDWQPSDLVESLEFVDGKDLRFRLRPGIMWSDGQGELTADDVKFSLERLLVADWKDSVRALDRVDVTGTYEGVVVMKHSFAPFMLTFLCDGVGSIVSRAGVEAAGGRYTVDPPAMCGPYLLSNWTPKQRIELTANPNWSGPTPAFHSVHIIPIEDDRVAELAFEAGELDITELSDDTATAYRENLPDGASLLTVPTVRYSWMGINTQHPKLTDIRVRRAIQHAVDVEAVNEAAYAGVPTRARGIVAPGLSGFRETSKFEARDAAAARALLEEAGVSDLTLVLHILNVQDQLAAAQVIQASLAEVGIKVEIAPVDSGVFWNLGQESQGEDWKDLQLWLMEFDSRPDASFAFQWFVSSQVGVWNWERWQDPAFDELYDAALLETDQEKRHQIYVQMQDMMEDTGGYVWINHRPQTFIYRNEIVPAVFLHGRHYYQWYERA